MYTNNVLKTKKSKILNIVIKYMIHLTIHIREVMIYNNI